MHKLDSIINDIEPRIESICNNVFNQEEPSLQTSLCAYGWILLDSWIAWRTLRYLLKTTFIDDNVSDKWFQTPSSYTASQIMAVWKFPEQTINYMQNKTGRSTKDIFDTVQRKRNGNAHFSRGNSTNGVEIRDIRTIYDCLSTVFLFCETGCFLNDVCVLFEKKQYKDFNISYSGYEIGIDKYNESISYYSESKEFSLFCCDCNNFKCEVSFSKTGCFAWNTTNPPDVKRPVVNDKVSIYNFFGNKGYYLNVDLFAETVMKCWNN